MDKKLKVLLCSEEEAKKLVANYEEGFKGTIAFAKKGSAFVRKNGYIVICPMRILTLFCVSGVTSYRDQDERIQGVPMFQSSSQIN